MSESVIDYWNDWTITMLIGFNIGRGQCQGTFFFMLVALVYLVVQFISWIFLTFHTLSTLVFYQLCFLPPLPLQLHSWLWQDLDIFWSRGSHPRFRSLNWWWTFISFVITEGVKTDMKQVGLQGDQIQILMKMKIMSERGGKEVRHEQICLKHT